MKNTFKRILCLFLALLMTAGLSLGAAAQDNEDGNAGDNEQVQSPLEGEEGKEDEDDKEDKDDKDDEKDKEDEKDKDGEKDKEDEKDKIVDFEVFSSDETISGNAIAITGKASFTLKGRTTYSSGLTKTGASWGSISNTSVVSRTSASGEFSTQAPGTSVIEVICPYDNNRVVRITVTVSDAPLESLKISGAGVSGGKLSMSGGDTLGLDAGKKPANTFNDNSITWKSSDTSVATVDSKGNVKALSKGTTEITASCDESGKTISDSITVTVTDPSANISDTAAANSGLLFSGIHSDMIRKFSGIYGKNPSSSAKVRFTSLGSSIYGTLYTSSSASTKVSANQDYSISDVKSMYLSTKATGGYSADYEIIDGGSVVTGRITVKITGDTEELDITIELGEVTPYTFSSSSTLGRVSAASTISSEIKDATGSSYGYISFGYPDSASKKVGTLYPTSSKNYELDEYNSYTSSSSGSSKQSPVSKLYFVPKTEGTFQISYIAYSSEGEELCSGKLIIEVNVAASSTVTVTLDDDDPYDFSTDTAKEKTSAASSISSIVSSRSKKNYNYIIFGSISSGSSVGTLYSDSDKTSLGNNRKFYRSTSQDYNVGELYFVPAKAGTYVRSFTAYDSSDNELLEGTLKIVVPDPDSFSSSANILDIYFNTTTGSTLTLGEDVFKSWFRQQKGSNYNLSYVTFDELSHGSGIFRHGSSSFTPGGATLYYTDSYTGSIRNTGSVNYLKNISYTAGNTADYISVSFTCYGGTGTSSIATKQSGTFFIFVTKNSVKSVDFDVESDSVLKLDEENFLTVYQNAMSSSLSNTKYHIELLEVPSKGALHYKYSSSKNTGTKLTSKNYSNYKFHINSSGDKVSSLTYVPDPDGSGSVKVRYLACDADGDPIYVGTINFNYAEDKVSSIICGSDGYTFKLSDFYSSGDSDGVSYVTFRQPASGVLMINYANGRGVPLDPAVRLYTLTPSAGSYPLTALTYIPKAGFVGPITIDYTTVTGSGKAASGVLMVSVTGRSASSRFTDVTSSGSGAWASDSIDFAYKWGLVSGTGDDTFSPDDTMSRAMLVTVLYRAAGSPKATGDNPFRDVSQSNYFYEPVIWAVENGIASGTSPNTFNPNGDVTREQVAAFLHRYAKYNEENVTSAGSLSAYTDQASVSSYAVEPMTWAVHNGYITSASGTEKVLSPMGNATRAQVAVMIHRYLTY